MLTTQEVLTLYPKFNTKKLAGMRTDGLKSIMLSGAYYYKYDDIIEYLMEEV